MTAGEQGALSGMGALVTGGSGGIGSACARWLLRDGASVTLLGRTEERLIKTVKSLAADARFGAKLQYVAGDGTRANDVSNAVERAADLAGQFDICVATLGGGTIIPLLMFEPEQFASELNRNIVSAFLAIKYSVPAMVKGGGGSIVCISSDAAKMAWQYMAAYCASKSGLEGLIRSAADELGHLNVRVNAVRPGLTQTESANSQRLFANKQLIKSFVEQKPLGRTGVPDDIAAGVRYLAGPESSWVTGQSFAIEGGNELRRAPSLESIARARYGDTAVDVAWSGQIPPGSPELTH
jgi:NAD(P)-dependent dehydrogenase (short-subunit alcohol dehydrogenase family)